MHVWLALGSQVMKCIAWPTCAASSCSFLAASVGPRPCCCGPVRPEADEKTCSADSMAATVITSSRHLRCQQQEKATRIRKGEEDGIAGEAGTEFGSQGASCTLYWFECTAVQAVCHVWLPSAPNRVLVGLLYFSLPGFSGQGNLSKPRPLDVPTTLDLTHKCAGQGQPAAGGVGATGAPPAANQAGCRGLQTRPCGRHKATSTTWL